MTSLSFAFAHSLPEIILAIGALTLVVVGAIRGRESDGPMTELAVGIIGLAILAILLSAKSTAIIFDGAFIDDAFGRFMKILALSGSHSSWVRIIWRAKRSTNSSSRSSSSSQHSAC
jgi:NADH-quinone oxidoreductase subunit N